MRSTLVTSALVATAAAVPTALTSRASDPCSKGCTNIPSTNHSVVVQIPLDIAPVQDVISAYQKYKSSSLKPPALNISGPGSTDELDDTYLFFSTYGIIPGLGVRESLGLVMTNDGELVYGVDVEGNTDFRVQYFDGKPHITYWSGAELAFGYGVVTLIDDQLHNITFNPTTPTIVPSSPPGKGPGFLDLHEHDIALDGASLVNTAYNKTPADLSAYGIKNGYVLDSVIIEYDIKTGEQLFLWNPQDHAKFTDSFLKPGDPVAGHGTESSPFDWCHINSAQKVGDNYLINSRHLWTMWMVNGTNGDIIWELNGKTGGDFAPFADNVTFAWEHYIRAVNYTADSPSNYGVEGKFYLTMFDNHDYIYYNENEAPANALMLELDLPPKKNMVPKVLRNLTTSEQIISGSQGTYIPYLSNGNALVGYGNAPIIREFAPEVVHGNNQKLLREWSFGYVNTAEAYRMFKFPWTATPAAYGPSLVAEAGVLSGQSQVYVSWNGATEVEYWNVYAGTSQSNLKLAGHAKKVGFETTFKVKGSCVQVAAVQGGQEVSRSNVDCTLL